GCKSPPSPATSPPSANASTCAPPGGRISTAPGSPGRNWAATPRPPKASAPPGSAGDAAQGNGRWICQPPREFPITAAEADNPRDNRRPVTLPTLPTKAEIRAELEAAVDNYLQTGGEIQQVARGVSGREDHRLLEKPLFDSPKTPRTYVNDLIAR